MIYLATCNFFSASNFAISFQAGLIFLLYFSICTMPVWDYCFWFLWSFALTAPPSVTIWPLAVISTVGAEVVIQCQVSGHPVPSIEWSKRGQSIRTGGKITKGYCMWIFHVNQCFFGYHDVCVCARIYALSS